MIPYSELVYFLSVLAILCAIVLVARWRNAAGPYWIAGATAIMLYLQYSSAPLHLAPNLWVPELVAVVVFGLYQWVLVRLALSFKALRRSVLLVPLSILPLVLLKYPIGHSYRFGFTGISYVSFRALDVLWSITDGVIAEVGSLDLLVFMFFFPTISSGPMDRFRRFRGDWRRVRTWADVLDDLNAGIPFVFRGLLYKYVIATLIEQHLLTHAEHGTELHGAIYYAYVYSAHLFFDFAGYSAFAVGVSRWFGVRSPENFKMPWSAPNIREFWNRWHISVSMWFRDHLYMRFVLTASKRKWFPSREITSSVGYFVSFGLMGVWHGHHYLIYGLYHATLMAGYDAWARWRKRHPTLFTAPGWKWVAHFLTINAVVFGLWLFAGHPWLTKEASAKATAAAEALKRK